jgi:hypothetical protein
MSRRILGGPTPRRRGERVDKETMKKTKLLVGLAAALCALAVAAVPAMGSEFVASKTGKIAGKGFEELPKVAKGEYREFEPEKMQEWKFGIFTVYCYSATNKGEITETSSNIMQINTKYGACGWYPKPKVNIHSPASFAKEGITVRFHANGFVETLENGEEVEFKGEILPSSAYIKVSNKICKIEIPAQTIPVKAIKHPEEKFSTVLYSNFTAPARKSKEFPNEEQERILLTNDWKGIRYHMGGEETQCTNPEEPVPPDGTNGVYKGLTEARLVGGNLKFVP